MRIERNTTYLMMHAFVTVGFQYICRFEFYKYEYTARYKAYHIQSVFEHKEFKLKQRCSYDFAWRSATYKSLITEFRYHGHVTNPVSCWDKYCLLLLRILVLWPFLGAQQ